MRQCPTDKKLVAVGGKERQNNLKIFDLETQKQIFTSKNVPHDSLQLEVPVWDSDLCFVKAHNTTCVATCSRYGYIRLYDYKSQRRPVNSYIDTRDQAFNSIATHDDLIFVSSTTGSLYAYDLKNLKVPLHTYKGATGSISSISVDPTGKYLFTASLDRYVRVHNIQKTSLLYQCYVKSKASQIIVKLADNLLLNENKKDEEQVVDSDGEYDNLFDKMQKTVEEENGSDEEPATKKRKAVPMKRHSGCKAPVKRAPELH